MSFLRNRRSFVRWDLGPGAKQHNAPPRPYHRLDESQLAIPWRVALQQSLPPLHQLVLSSRQPAGTANLIVRKVEEFSTGEMRNFQPALTYSLPPGYRRQKPVRQFYQR